MHSCAIRTVLLLESCYAIIMSFRPIKDCPKQNSIPKHVLYRPWLCWSVHSFLGYTTCCSRNPIKTVYWFWKHTLTAQTSGKNKHIQVCAVILVRTMRWLPLNVYSLTQTHVLTLTNSCLTLTSSHSPSPKPSGQIWLFARLRPVLGDHWFFRENGPPSR